MSWKHGYTFATIRIVGNDVPIILGIEGVKEYLDWKPVNAPADSKADVVASAFESPAVRQSMAIGEVKHQNG